jgi:hypothetical protein
MLTSLLLGAALAAPGAPIPRDADPAPAGPAPWVLYLKTNENGQAQVLVYKKQKSTINRQIVEHINGKAVTKLVQEEVERLSATYVGLETLNPKFTTVQGTERSADAVLKKAKDGLVVFVSADGKPVSKTWLRAVDPDAVIVAAEGLVSPVAPRATTPIPTAAPRLVLLGTAADGKVQVAYNPAGESDSQQFHGNRVAVFINNGNGAIFVNNDGMPVRNSAPLSAVAPIKPLEDTKFDAYDLNGKAVAKADALKRLKAGGLVLIAGDTAAPDAGYLNMFRGDLIVLASPELVNVPLGTKSKSAEGPPIAAPAVLPAAVPALAARPILVRPAVIKVAPLPVAPPRAAPSKPVEK